MSKFKQYILDEYDTDELKNIANHGMAGGVNGFIYYDETTAAYEFYEEEIWDRLTDEAEGLGYSSAIDLIASFNGSNGVICGVAFRNLLVWWFVESIAQDFINELEEKCEV